MRNSGACLMLWFGTLECNRVNCYVIDNVTLSDVHDKHRMTPRGVFVHVGCSDVSVLFARLDVPHDLLGGCNTLVSQVLHVRTSLPVKTREDSPQNYKVEMLCSN